MLQNLHSTVTHIFREANSAEDKLASMKAQDDFLNATIQQLLGVVKAAILLDSREFSFAHMQVVKA